MTLLAALDFGSVLIFALTGALVASRAQLDIVGFAFIACLTAVGGGTLRDIMIGSTPVAWMQDDIYVYLIMATVPIIFLAKPLIQRLRRGVFLFDTIGIGLFTILGLQKTLALGLSPLIAIMMGVVSAVFGGVIRDVLSDREPLIFRKEIYALACLAGALFYLGALEFFEVEIAMLISITIVIAIRLLAIRFSWEVPFRPIKW